MLAIIVCYQTLLFLISKSFISLQVRRSLFHMLKSHLHFVFYEISLLLSFAYIYIRLLIYSFFICGILFWWDKLAVIWVESRISSPRSRLYLLTALLSRRQMSSLPRWIWQSLLLWLLGFLTYLERPLPLLSYKKKCSFFIAHLEFHFLNRFLNFVTWCWLLLCKNTACLPFVRALFCVSHWHSQAFTNNIAQVYF